MRIYMSFRDHEIVAHAPSTTWLSGHVLLELMQLGNIERGEVSIDVLKLGIERARSALLDNEIKRPMYARQERERKALLVVLDLFDGARREAKQQGATRFTWREDF